MKDEKAVDYLIIGQGIAGSVLAFAMLEQGLKVLVVDKPEPFSTSKVAAGLFNPITGRKMTKTWLAEELFPALHAFYPKLEQTVGAKFFYPRAIYVPFDSVEKQNAWLSRTAEPGYPPFVKGFAPNDYPRALHGQWGGMRLRQSGFIHTRTMLAACRSHLQTLGAYQEGFVAPHELELTADGVRWQGVQARTAVFCEGIRNRLNPYFEWLDYRPAKGEILTLDMPEAPFEEVVNRGCWIIPQPEGGFRVGSNFERSTAPEPSAKGREQVEEKLALLTPLGYTITDHQAGIRPATYDRRPFMGRHPEHAQLALFGGLGSKGTSLAPYFAQHLLAHLQSQAPLMAAVDLCRKK